MAIITANIAAAKGTNWSWWLAMPLYCCAFVCTPFSQGKLGWIFFDGGMPHAREVFFPGSFFVYMEQCIVAVSCFCIIFLPCSVTFLREPTNLEQLLPILISFCLLALLATVYYSSAVNTEKHTYCRILFPSGVAMYAWAVMPAHHWHYKKSPLVLLVA